MQTSVAPKLQTFMEAQWLRVFSLLKYHMIAQSVESVLLTKIHVESQIVFSKMHQRGNVKKGNMGIGKSVLNQCMSVYWPLNHLSMIHITFIDLKRENMVLTLASALNMGHY